MVDYCQDYNVTCCRPPKDAARTPPCTNIYSQNKLSTKQSHLSTLKDREEVKSCRTLPINTVPSFQII